ncbi:conserved hypothetical protein [Streptomyces sp. SPB074]|nr:conserved hypothetical protein [Streptomyces sp. SPB074]
MFTEFTLHSKFCVLNRRNPTVPGTAGRAPVCPDCPRTSPGSATWNPPPESPAVPAVSRGRRGLLRTPAGASRVPRRPRPRGRRRPRRPPRRSCPRPGSHPIRFPVRVNPRRVRVNRVTCGARPSRCSKRTGRAPPRCPRAPCTRTSGRGTRPSSRSVCGGSTRSGRAARSRRCSRRSGRDGRVPHIVFNPAVPLDAYFPSPDFWRSSRTPGAPAAPETSGIVQPPVHALAVWLVHRAAPRSPDSLAFLARMYPRLVAWHRYLGESRDLGGAGLAALVHPWESGMDNSPCWDAPLTRVVPAPRASYRRADLDHGSAADRPTDLDYGRYVRLAAAYRDGGYADRAKRPDGARFAVEDPGFNALLIASEYALAAIAAELGEDPGPRARRARELTEVLVERLWEPGAGLFLSRDLEGKPAGGGAAGSSGGSSRTPARTPAGALVPECGAAGLLPLLLPWLPEGSRGRCGRRCAGRASRSARGTRSSRATT